MRASIMLSSKEIRERYRHLYVEDIRMGNICSDEDIPTEEEYLDQYVDETSYMEEYYERKYGK